MSLIMEVNRMDKKLKRRDWLKLASGGAALVGMFSSTARSLSDEEAEAIAKRLSHPEALQEMANCGSSCVTCQSGVNCGSSCVACVNTCVTCQQCVGKCQYNVNNAAVSQE